MELDKIKKMGSSLFGMGELELEKLYVSVPRWWIAMHWPNHRDTEAIISAWPHPQNSAKSRKLVPGSVELI